jgi:hypothetical protein
VDSHHGTNPDVGSSPGEPGRPGGLMAERLRIRLKPQGTAQVDMTAFDRSRSALQVLFPLQSERAP